MVDEASNRVIPYQSATAGLRCLTADWPGVGGVIKQRVEDFCVDELPLYEASGEGEHLMLLIQRSNMTTMDVVRQLARVFRVGKKDVGYAGLKDKLAATRQYFTIHLPDRMLQQEGLDRLSENDRMQLIEVKPHRNKLRRGHLAGNRFTINIRDAKTEDVEGVNRILDLLKANGVPNYVGPQRFGYRQVNHELGRLMILERWQDMLDLMLGMPSEMDQPGTRAGREAYERGDYELALEHWPKHLRPDRQALDALRQGKSHQQAVKTVDAMQRQFLISSLQSYMFNQVVDQRLRDGTLGKLLPGDLAWIEKKRAVFAVNEQTAELENSPGGRIESLDISPSGPMWGVDMICATGQPGEMERQVLADCGLTIEQLDNGKKERAVGVRRPLRTPLLNPEVLAGSDQHGAYLRISFELNRGCFATTVLREIMKVPMYLTESGRGQELDE